MSSRRQGAGRHWWANRKPSGASTERKCNPSGTSRRWASPKACSGSIGSNRAIQWREILGRLPATVERDELVAQLDSAGPETLAALLTRAEGYCERVNREGREAMAADELQKAAAGYVDLNAAETPVRPPASPTPSGDARLERCWTILGELAAMGSSAEVDGLIERARKVAQAPEEQSALLLDSLVLEISGLLRSRRQWEELQQAVELVLEELSALDTDGARERITRLQRIQTSAPAKGGRGGGSHAGRDPCLAGARGGKGNNA